MSNTGYRNTGYRNTGSYETGAFNTIQADKIRVFNKECSREEWDNAEKPDFLYFNITEWISSEDMTDKENRTDTKFCSEACRNKHFKQNSGA